MMTFAEAEAIVTRDFLAEPIAVITEEVAREAWATYLEFKGLELHVDLDQYWESDIPEYHPDKYGTYTRSSREPRESWDWPVNIGPIDFMHPHIPNLFDINARQFG